jgi:hypothetical protein
MREHTPVRLIHSPRRLERSSDVCLRRAASSRHARQAGDTREIGGRAISVLRRETVTSGPHWLGLYAKPHQAGPLDVKWRLRHSIALQLPGHKERRSDAPKPYGTGATMNWKQGLFAVSAAAVAVLSLEKVGVYRFVPEGDRHFDAETSENPHRLSVRVDAGQIKAWVSLTLSASKRFIHRQNKHLRGALPVGGCRAVVRIAVTSRTSWNGCLPSRRVASRN